MINKIIYITIIIITSCNTAFCSSYSWSNFEYGNWKYSYHVPNFVLKTQSYNGDELILSNSYKHDINTLNNNFKIKIGINNPTLNKSYIGKTINCYAEIGSIRLNGYCKIMHSGTYEIYINNLINTIYKSNNKNLKLTFPEIHKNTNFTLDGFDDAYYSAINDHKNGFHNRSFRQSNDILIAILVIGGLILLSIIGNKISNIFSTNNHYKYQQTNNYNNTTDNNNFNYEHINYIQEYGQTEQTIHTNYSYKYTTNNINTTNGNVYILSNQAMPGIYKIGCTSRNTEERVKELNSVTSIPTPFNIEYILFSNQYKAIERNTHKILHKYNFGKEFFKLELFKCIIQLKNIAHQHDKAYTEYYRDKYIKTDVENNFK